MPVAVGDAVAYAGHAQGVVGDGGERQYPAEQGAEEGGGLSRMFHGSFEYIYRCMCGKVNEKFAFSLGLH